MITLILDTESTGLIEPIQPIEMAWIRLNNDLSSLRGEETFLGRYKPDKSIELGAKVTSHILEEDLVDEISHTECILDVPEATSYLIGHNIDYDWKVLGKPDIKRICTKALSSWLWSGLDSYSQSALIYYHFPLDARTWLKESHNALCDIQNNFKLLKVILTEIENVTGTIPTVHQLWEMSEEARIPKLATFGKFRGLPFTAMDNSYVSWWLTKSDTKPDEYQLKALRQAGFKV